MNQNKRIGNQVNSIFTPTTAVEYETPAKRVEEHVQPKIEQKKNANRKTIKSTITLYVDQVAFLDRLSADILCESSAVVDRGSIIRGILSALQESKIDMKNVTNENAITSYISESFVVKNSRKIT